MFNKCIISMSILCQLIACSAQAALTVDRSRLIYNEGAKSVSLNVTNRNEKEPYLAQGWMEDDEGKKITSPMIVLPPVQRVEAGAKTLVRIQSLPELKGLPKDRESVFYFNLREIPPKNDKKNVLTLAMQTTLKVFYRPSALKVDPMLDRAPGADTLTLTKKEGKYEINNPTPYYYTFVGVQKEGKDSSPQGIEAVMVSPKDTAASGVPVGTGDEKLELFFINDYGSQVSMPFACSGSICKVDVVKKNSKSTTE